MRRRNIFWLAVFILGGFFIFSGFARSANTDIIINEIGAYPTSTHEWIEIWNKGSETVDLTGWKFWENNTSHGLTAVSSSDALVAPGEYAAIVQDGEQFLIDYPVFGGSVFDSSWGSLSENGEAIGLKDTAENFVEQFTYIAAPNFSLERKNPYLADYTSANWAEHPVGQTVGEINSNFSTSTATTTPETPTTTVEVSTSSLWARLKINEVVSDPAGGNEWVEFFNPSTSSLDLAGGYLCDSRGATSTADCKDLSGSIGALGWLKFDWSGYFLNNDGDEVILRNPEGQAADQIVYGESNLSVPAKGQALARKVDGVDTDTNEDWSITIQPTPGEANVITAPVVNLPPSSGGGGTLESPKVEAKKTATSTAKTTTAAVKKVKEIGLIWKVKYDPRVRVGTTTVLDASGSLDPRGGRAEMSWNLGEGAPLSGEKIIYTFVSSGPHDVIIYATTTAGTVDKKQIKIMVYPVELKTGAGVVIDKILPNTVGADEREYVAIKNITSSTINISSWKILAGEKIYNLPTSTFILAGDNLIFYHAATGLILANSGGVVELRDENDILVDELEYGKAKEGQIIGESVSSTLIRDSSNPASSTVTKKISDKRYAIKNYGRVTLIQARGLEKDSLARVRGVVTVLPGMLGSQFFYISDGQNGLQIYQYKKDFPELKVGDEIEVHGAISVSGEIKRLRLANKKAVDILSTANVVTPLPAELGELDEAPTGNLIKIKGEITEIKSNFMYVDDGTAEAVVYFKKGSAIDKKKIQEGEQVEVTGILEQAKTGLQLWPRSNQDIVSLGPSEDLLKKQQLAVGAKGSDTAEKYLTATAGGLTTLFLGFLARARGAVIWGAGKRALAFLGGLIKRG